ncbi:glycosyltransferase [Streptomyces boluensis]|uniref:D-inositol 3-phosphate glycosyltransferase n=1 Tax=Streptomyces boluensis TaxID=1775135 RepID=A0A964XNH9_9ACTN|nr:glycosyltransferase [Streptomyces boluensis]NBE53603.1 glycosyltransferase [Streptomyces boluensis]
MKITYLLARGDEAGGTERAAYTQAGQLADRCDVEILSVFRTRPDPLRPEARHLPVRYLVDRTVSPARPVRASRLDEDTCRTLAALPSELAAPARESAFDRLSDIELATALSALDTDVLVSTDPTLLAAAVTHVPARVVTVHQEHQEHHEHQEHQEHQVTQRSGPSVEPVLLHAPRLDALVTPSASTRDRLRDSLGPSAPELAVIPGALPDGFRPRADGESRVVVMAARLTGERRVDHAVEAFARIADAHPGWTLRVFGDGPREDELRRLVDGLCLQDRVELLGPCQDLAAEWAKAGLGLATARTEAFGHAMVEALAAGVPVVAYDVPTGPAEIVRHRVDGLLVPSGDIDALAAALGSLMGNPETRRGLARAAREGVRARFSAAEVTARWEELFGRLLARRNTPERRDGRADRLAASVASGGTAFRPTAPHSPSAPPGPGERDRENELLEADRGRRLIRSAGRIAERRDDLTAARAVDANLELTASALESYDIPYVLLRTGAVPHTLAVDAGHRDGALKALAAALHGRPVYAEPVGPRDAAPGTVLAERLDGIGELAGVKVFRPVVTTTLTLRYDAAQACTVAFWTEAPDGSHWRAPSGSTTLAGAVLPSLRPTATLDVAGRPYPTLAVFAERLVEDIDFPVDAVCTWGAGRDQLRFTLRSLSQYAPWIRHVHLVTAGRRPDWLTPGHPGLTVVDHRDLCRIDGLSEHFLHFTDGVFLGRPTTPDTFFLSSGLGRVFRSTASAPAPPLTLDDEGDRALLRRDFGRTPTHGFPVAPYALRRSVLAELSERYAAELGTTSRALSLYQDYAYLTGRAVPGELSYAHADLGDAAGHARLGRILHGRGSTAFRLGEAPGGALSEQERTLAARAFLAAYFPVRSPYERA